MKFRDLKHKKFIIYFDCFINNSGEHYNTVARYEDGLSGTAEWEYDNGLYTETGYYVLNLTWKDIKYNLSHYDKRLQEKYRIPYSILVYNGKCRKCKNHISFKEFEEWNGICEECGKKLYDTLA